MCASDFAAMLEVAMLPAMSAAAGRGVLDSSYEADCRAMAIKLNLPRMDYPFYVSLDNAKVHAHGRARLLTERAPPPAILQSMRSQILDTLCNVNLTPAQFVSEKRVLTTFLAIGGTAALESAECSDLLIGLYYQLCDKNPNLPKHPLYWRHRWCLQYEQCMPLAPKTPDMHCVVEHVVGTLKAWIKWWSRMQDCYLCTLFLAVTWQAALNVKIAELMADDRSLMTQHVLGSIMNKWKNATRICAAAVGEMVTCITYPGRYQSGPKGRGRPARGPVVVQEPGTAGAWTPAKYG